MKYKIMVSNSEKPEELDCIPLNLSVIPNYMGINLCSVRDVLWEKQDDGQLVSLTINFIPDNEGGSVNELNLEDTKKVRSERFIISERGDEVTDTRTGLTWARCSVGRE